MEFLELSIEDVNNKSKDLYEIISSVYDYDLVIFIAKGSYIIGKNLSEYKNVPLLEIYATRKGGIFKKMCKPLFKIVPKKILIKLRKKEMNSSYHEINNDRKVTFDKEVYAKYKNCKRILLVDDSIDSGNSIKLTKTAIESFFGNCEVKVAVFNIMSKSTVSADFTLYRDMMICGPWSSDSKENNLYQNLYYKWKKK